MSTDGAAGQSHETSGRVGPADVESVLFTRSGLGRRGYDEAEVDVFLDRVQTELGRLINEKSALRDEVVRLKSKLAEQGGGRSHDEASAQAVSMLSVAQHTADQYIADAESYSKRLSREAKDRYEQIVEEAVARARAILEEAESAGRAAEDVATSVDTDSATELTRAELEQQVAYLRTFGQVTRVQLRSYLEALLRDVELEWGRAHPGAVPEASAVPAPPPVVQVGTVQPEAVEPAPAEPVSGQLEEAGTAAEDRALLRQ